MTYPIEQNLEEFKRGLAKALALGRRAEITSVLITGKGEPTANPDMLKHVLWLTNQMFHFPIEVQSHIKNSFSLQRSFDLFKHHVDILALSIEKFDADALYIRTRPLSGAQFFEFWRKDNASGPAKAQANLHSIRRVAELEFSSQEGTITCVECRVKVFRLSVPERPIQGAIHFGGQYTKSHNRQQTLEIDSDRAENIEWLDAGPDHDLERRILEYIQRDIQKGKNG